MVRTIQNLSTKFKQERDILKDSGGNEDGTGKKPSNSKENSKESLTSRNKSNRRHNIGSQR